MWYALYTKQSDRWILYASSNDKGSAEILANHRRSDGTLVLIRKYWLEHRIKKVIRQ